MLFVLALACAPKAHADVYNWSYADYYHSGSGTLTTSGTTITGLTGTFDGGSVTLQAPGTCCNYPGNDNQLYASSSNLLSTNGFTFQNINSDYQITNYQVFYDNNGQTAYAVENGNSEVITFGTFTAAAQPTSLPPPAVPEPASIGMFAAGLAGLAFLFACRDLAARGRSKSQVSRT
jgi:hypothetical protein